MANLAEELMTSGGALFSTEREHEHEKTKEVSGGEFGSSFQGFREVEKSRCLEKTFADEISPNLDRKKINRELTLKELSPSEDRIQEERRNLVEKEFAEGISSRESRRLVYLEWQLDRLDDARQGEGLDRLEGLIELHEKTAVEINDAIESLNRAVRMGGKRGYGRRG
jgi:hypothetical protein